MELRKQHSIVTLPQVEKPYPSILDFLCNRFSAIPRKTWEKRILDGKVTDEISGIITLNSPYIPHHRIFYYREVDSEPIIPFDEKIIYMDDHILVACKPHFLPVTPSGCYVDECLLNRLRRRTAIDELVPLHRIDRETAGLVLFSVNKKSRGNYGTLFMNGLIEKTYKAISNHVEASNCKEWHIENRIVCGEPWFRMKVLPGVVNARSHIILLEVKGNRSHFILKPQTGKTHQLRIHLSDLGFGIINDRYYPELQEKSADDFDNPLQLLAQKIQFKDPINGTLRQFESERKLKNY